MSNIRQYLVAALSIGFMVCLAGCSDKTDKSKSESEKSAKKTTKKDGDDHQHDEGPHGGDIVDLGNHEYRAEIVFKEKEREFSVYLLGHNDNKPVFSKDKSIMFKHKDKKIEVKLDAAPQSGDADGMTSCFQAKGKALPKELQDEHDLEGGYISVKIIVKGKETPFSATIKGHDHEH